jgi:TRAP-type mannitol/chloroaromatic compound transport system substrate-binding protein
LQQGNHDGKEENMNARALAVSALVLLTAAPGAAEAEAVTLVTPVVYGLHLPGLGQPASGLAKLIKEDSAGSLELDLKQPGEGTEPQDILDKVSEGKVDAGFTTGSFWAAKLPAAALFSGFPFGPDAKAYLDWFDHGNGLRLYQEMYDHAGLKIHVIPCAFGGAEAGGWFAKEIKSKRDLEGLRMRIFGLGGRVMSQLGVAPVLLSGGRLPDAFARKEIDAAELYTPAVDQQQGLKEKVKLIYMPGWHQPETVMELIVNQDRWKALSEEQRGVIEKACDKTLRSTLADSALKQAEALTNLSREGVRVEPWPDDVMAALREGWAEVAKEEGNRDYFFRTTLEDMERFRAKTLGTSEPQPLSESKVSPSPEPAQGPKAEADSKPLP